MRADKVKPGYVVDVRGEWGYVEQAIRRPIHDGDDDPPEDTVILHGRIVGRQDRGWTRYCDPHTEVATKTALPAAAPNPPGVAAIPPAAERREGPNVHYRYPPRRADHHGLAVRGQSLRQQR
jgi:hypothetical protein